MSSDIVNVPCGVLEANTRPSSGMPSLAVARLTPYVTDTNTKHPLNRTGLNRIESYCLLCKVNIRLERCYRGGVMVWGKVPAATYGTVLIISPLSR